MGARAAVLVMACFGDVQRAGGTGKTVLEILGTLGKSLYKHYYIAKE